MKRVAIWLCGVSIGLGGLAAQAQVSLEGAPLVLQPSSGLRHAPAAPRSPALPSEAAELAKVISPSTDCQTGTPTQPETAVRLADVLRAVVCASAGVRQGPGLSLQAESALQRARAAGLPRASASLRVGSAVDEPTAATAGVRLDWVLFDFGNQRASVKQGEAAIQAVSGELGAQALAAVASAAQLHAAAVSSFSRFDTSATNLRIAADSARLADARQSAGVATLSDKLQAQTALGQARLDHARAQTQWLTARAALAAAMGLPPQTPLDLAASETLDVLEAEQAPDLLALAEEARRSHPRVLAAQSRVRESRFRSEAANAERWGAVTLSARADRGRNLNDGSGSRSSTAAVEWAVPLFDGGVQRSREKEALGQRKVREVELEEAERQVALQVWQAGQALTGDRTGVRNSRAVAESAEGALHAATQRYRLGAGSFADLLSAQGAAAAARLQRVEAQSNLLLAHLRLAAAVGRLVDASAPP